MLIPELPKRQFDKHAAQPLRASLGSPPHLWGMRKPPAIPSEAGEGEAEGKPLLPPTCMESAGTLPFSERAQLTRGQGLILSRGGMKSSLKLADQECATWVRGTDSKLHMAEAAEMACPLLPTSSPHTSGLEAAALLPPLPSSSVPPPFSMGKGHCHLLGVSRAC